MLFCQAFFPINENTSRHTSLVSNVDNCWHLSVISLTLTWTMWEIDLMARMLCHSLIAHNSRSQKLTTTMATASSSSKGHSALFQRLPSYCVFRGQRARDNLSFNASPWVNAAIRGGGGRCSTFLPKSPLRVCTSQCHLLGSQRFTDLRLAALTLCWTMHGAPFQVPVTLCLLPLCPSYLIFKAFKISLILKIFL